VKPEDRSPEDEAIEFLDGIEAQSKLHSEEKLKNWSEKFKVGRDDGRQPPN